MSLLEAKIESLIFCSPKPIKVSDIIKAFSESENKNFITENSQNPETFQMNLKIGIHMGEVYEKKGDLFGEGVNLAARIEPLAKYGGTVTTQAVYNSIRSEKNIFIRDHDL